MTRCGHEPEYARGLCRACYDRARTHHTIPISPQRNPDDVAEDVQFLLDSGETHPEAITTRLGYRTIRGLYDALRAAARFDLVDRLQHAHDQQRKTSGNA